MPVHSRACEVRFRARGPLSRFFAPGLTADGLCLPLPSDLTAKGWC
ncbi:protein of unknown function [Streptantibioticus cattleyicolor NRRL 8057 = DSM 46488]|nr:protein of unknown function [Streptantibioticus cattleyicolor NRRL 8057 = DSM 46488]